MLKRLFSVSNSIMSNLMLEIASLVGRYVR
jgi:hypothetical protein